MVRADIQGLRAIAVTSVVLFHVFPDIFPGGFVGVDVFFVISGYLITNSIFTKLVRGNFSLLEFYSHRVIRIIPALLICIIATTAASYFLISPNELIAFAKSAISAIFFSSNIYFWKTSGYFDLGSELKPLLQTWSLGVEEQFYIFFPFGLLIIFRYFRKFYIYIIAIALILSLLISEIFSYNSPVLSYFLLPTRLFEPLVGAILAILQNRFVNLGRVARNATCLAGLVLVIAPVFILDKSHTFPGLNALYPCIGAALIIVAGLGDTIVAASRLITGPIFRFLGDISYSLYLWHWPILALLRTVYGPDLMPFLSVDAIVASLICGFLSFRFVEQPFMRSSFSRKQILTGGITAMTVTALLMAPIFATKGFPDRFSGRALELFASASNYSPVRDECHSGNRNYIPYSKNCLFGDPNATEIFVVWGDSHGVELAYALGQASRRDGRAVMQITASACPPSIGFTPPARPGCVAHNRETLAAISVDKRVSTVVLIANGASYPANRQKMVDGFEAAVEKLAISKKNVLLLKQIPIFDRDPSTTLGYAVFSERDISKIGTSRENYQYASKFWNDELGKISKQHDLRLIATDDILCWNDFCPMYRPDTGPLYFDAVHMNLTAAERVAKIILNDTGANDSP